MIGLALDGTGYGTDGHIWGGEIFVADLESFDRVGHFSYLPMPGGDKAIKEPWRMGLSYLYNAYQYNGGDKQSDDAFIDWMKDLPLMKSIGKNDILGVVNMIRRSINTPMTSSLGRLFDGVASLTGIRQKVAFEGQGALELEQAMGDVDGLEETEGYPFEHNSEDGAILISTYPVIIQIRKDVLQGVSPREISLKFHSGLVRLLSSICREIQKKTNLNVVALSGGCFQNKYLVEKLTHSLEESGFTVLTHSQVPVNDGGLSLGQAVIAGKRFIAER